ncbi:MAG: hypothetical protein GTO18_19475 [Anaerolineales bacterium]|nr:hypothetical protein [Anaerolineales bacterium]
MSAKMITGISWFEDRKAKEKGEPGIRHSYMASLATTLHYLMGGVDPTWLMGTSAFAFRIIVNEVMCPSAMSVFNWTLVLPEAVEQAGFHCEYVSRLWHEAEIAEEKRFEAHSAIVEGIKRDVPAVVWDVADAEWGLIVGYDEEGETYDTLTWEGKPSRLPFDKLGLNGIDVLSVTITDSLNQRSHEEVVNNSLETAVAHAEQGEWTERPEYQDGLPAYDLWAQLCERWAMLLDAGKAEKIDADLPAHADYYASHWYSARCYARDYVESISDGDRNLREAFSSYKEVASRLEPVWKYFSEASQPETEDLKIMAQNIRSAKSAEEKGISQIKEYLENATH